MRLSSLCALLALVVFAGSAHATALEVRTIEFGSWPAAVAALEGDLQGEGRAVHVFVHDEHGFGVPCENYSLSLDAIGARAFAVGACDEATGATELHLVHRSALFAHDGDLVPTPLPAGIRATEMRTGGASGGAGGAGGSELSCTLAVRPYLTNLETGARVYLTPGRFAMHVLNTSVRADGNPAGWTLRGPAGGAVSVDYEVIDTTRNVRVLRDRATLQCERSSIDDDVTPLMQAAPSEPSAERTETHVATTCRDAVAIGAGSSFGGSTLGGARRPIYRIDVATPTHVLMHMNSEFGGSVEVYAGCPGFGAPYISAGVFGGGDDQRLHLDLAPGVYYVQIVDADIERHHGTYWFRDELITDPFAEMATSSSSANATMP